MTSTHDQWAQWLLERRHGGDEEQLHRVFDALMPVREKVLENCALAGDETLLDVGCGDGLIAFGALDRLDAGKVIFSDISADLLRHVEALAKSMNVQNRCEFVQADVTTLSPIADETVDAVTMRSVLIYVVDKLSALHSIYRVLKPEGVLSFFEPMNRFAHPEPAHLLWGYDIAQIIPLAEKIKAVYRTIQPADTDPMLNFDERDLLAYLDQVGFSEVHLEMRAEIMPLSELGERTWEQFIHVAPNPKVPTLHEAMEQTLSRKEINQLTNYLRPKVEIGDGTLRSAIVYIWAVK